MSQGGADVVQFQNGATVVDVLQLLQHVLEGKPQLVDGALRVAAEAEILDPVADCFTCEKGKYSKTNTKNWAIQFPTVALSEPVLVRSLRRHARYLGNSFQDQQNLLVQHKKCKKKRRKCQKIN